MSACLALNQSCIALIETMLTWTGRLKTKRRMCTALLVRASRSILRLSFTVSIMESSTSTPIAPALLARYIRKISSVKEVMDFLAKAPLARRQC